MHPPPFSAYKPSDVEWLGDVPAHWEVKKLKHWLIVNQQTISEETDPDYTFNYVDISSVSTGRLVKRPERLKFRDCPSRARRIVQEGDTIMSTVRTYLKAVWHAEKVNSNLVVSTGFAVLTPKSCTCAKFVSYLCLSENFVNQVTANSEGIAYPAIAETKLKSFSVGVPPLLEQIAIANFLDHATDQIESYIRAKEKLIALLEEQKQVMIHDAVTGRIDVRTGKPYPAYKPSDVEWQQKIPTHWKRKRLKFLLRSVDHRSVTGRETLLSLRRDYGVVVFADHFSHPPQGNSHVGYKIVEIDQLVVNRLQANNGLVFCSRLSGLVSPDYSVFESQCPLNMLFLSEVLRTSPVRTHFRRQATGLGTGTSGFLRLYDDKFLNTSVALPSIEEQRRIVAFVDQFTTQLSDLVSRTFRQIKLVREYRTRLIADVVTGKLDVREAAANLPELEAVAEGSGEITPTKSDSQQSNTTLHNEALQTVPGASS